MRVNYDSQSSTDLVVSDSFDSVDNHCEVFGCTVPKSVWNSYSRELGKSIVTVQERGLFEPTISKMGSLDSHMSLHPDLIREGNLLKIGFADNLAVKYPFRIKSIRTVQEENAGSTKKVFSKLELQPCLGGDVKQLEYEYFCADDDTPDTQDEIMQMNLFNPSCEKENKSDSLDSRFVHLLEDSHILIAVDQTDDFLAKSL